MRGIVGLVVLSNLLTAATASPTNTDARPPTAIASLASFTPGHVAPASPLHENTVELDERNRRATVARPWHMEFSMRSSHTKLASTKQQLDRRLALPLKLDVFGVFDTPYTPMDRKTDLGLTTFYFGFGRQESERLVWTAYAGAGAGSDESHQRFLNANLSTRFRYATAYTGVSVEWYPWETPKLANDLSWPEQLRRAKPFLLTGLELGFVDAYGAGDFSLAPVRIYHDRQGIRDWLVSYKVGFGWRIPLDKDWSASLAGDYSFHFYRPEEYNSWNAIFGLRYRF